MDTAEIVEDIWRKAQEFMHLSGTYMDDAHIGKADDLYLFQTIVDSKVSRTYICPDDHACQCGAGIRVTEFKRKCYSNSRAHTISTAIVCESCMLPGALLVLVASRHIRATALPMGLAN